MIGRQKGGIMQATFTPDDIDRLMAEADELIKQINSNAIKDMEEEHRIQYEKHAHSLKKLRSEIQEKKIKEGTAESGSYGQGMHEAIVDIIVNRLGKKIAGQSGNRILTQAAAGKYASTLKLYTAYLREAQILP
jgi:hypothetical protein